MQALTPFVVQDADQQAYWHTPTEISSTCDGTFSLFVAPNAPVLTPFDIEFLVNKPLPVDSVSQLSLCMPALSPARVECCHATTLGSYCVDPEHKSGFGPAKTRIIK